MAGEIIECSCGMVVIVDGDGLRWVLTDGPIWRFRAVIHLHPVCAHGR